MKAKLILIGVGAALLITAVWYFALWSPQGKDLDEAKANEALRKAEEARANAKDKQELATVEGELSMLAAQLAAIRKLRKK